MKLRAKKPSATFLIILCFLSSGVIRVWENGDAIASEVGDASAMLAGGDPMEPQNCPAPYEPAAMIAAILEREASLDALEQTLMDREQVLRVAKLRLEDQLVVLEDAEKRLAETLAIADNATEKDLARLTAVYENMKPKEAAQIFETMDVTFAAGFLSRMRPDSAAGILSSVDKTMAYAISVAMAGRNIGAPTE